MIKATISTIQKITINSIVNVLILLVWCVTASVVYAGVGTTSAEFLLLGNGARPSALANTFTAVADDAHTIGFNPAGLGRITQRQLSLMHSVWLVDTNYQYSSFVQPLAKGSLGVSLMYVSAGDMVGRSTMEQETGNFSASDIACTMGYGFPLTQEIFLGFSGKFIRQNIDNLSRSGGAVDAGVLYEIISDKFYTGASILNIGPKLSAFETEEETLPTCYRMGVGYYALEKKLLLATDVKHIIHGKPTVSAGLEYLIKTILFLRSGVAAGSEIDHSLTWTGGVGFALGNYYLDYCYEPFGDLDVAHKISLIMKF